MSVCSLCSEMTTLLDRLFHAEDLRQRSSGIPLRSNERAFQDYRPRSSRDHCWASSLWYRSQMCRTRLALESFHSGRRRRSQETNSERRTYDEIRLDGIEFRGEILLAVNIEKTKTVLRENVAKKARQSGNVSGQVRMNGESSLRISCHRPSFIAWLTGSFLCRWV